MEALQIFKSEQFGDMRTSISDNNDPLFCLADVCRSLEIGNVSQCKTTLDEEGVISNDTLTNGGIQKMTFINESNFYQVIFQSRKPEAKQFKKWVTSEVLPAIRKNGIYATDVTIDKMVADPDFAIKLLTNYKEERQKRIESEQENERLQFQNDQQQQEIKAIAPKAEYYDTVLESTGTLLTDQIAKDMGMTAQKLNKILHEKKIQFKRDGQWVLYSAYAGNGFTETRTIAHSSPKSDGTFGTSLQTRWTQKGRKFIYELLNFKQN